MAELSMRYSYNRRDTRLNRSGRSFFEAARYRACASRFEAARYRTCASRTAPTDWDRGCRGALWAPAALVPFRFLFGRNL